MWCALGGFVLCGVWKGDIDLVLVFAMINAHHGIMGRAQCV